MKEILDEVLEDIFLDEGVSFESQKEKMCIHVNPDIKRVGDEYFKVYDSDRHQTAKRVARILFRKSQYVYHKDGKAKATWEMTAKERRKLIKILNTPIPEEKMIIDRNGAPKEVTYWMKTIAIFNREKFGIEEDEMYTDQRTLLKKHPDIIPLDLDQPDYTNISEPSNKGNKTTRVRK